MLRVTTPGRFAIRAHSATGTALQLVDMLTGPCARARAGRARPTGASTRCSTSAPTSCAPSARPARPGRHTLAATGFAEAAPPVLAPGYQPATLQLRDLQVQGFWLVVGRTMTSDARRGGRPQPRGR